ncbi:MAG: MFS transporter [Planctomycetia bacterium]|nr:MFS transporter [Planctomycetia bacterium]
MYKSIKSLLRGYKAIPKSTLQLIGGIFLLNLVNGSFILILNIYLRKVGFVDEQIGSFTSYRFLGVLFFAFPFGIFIKGKSLKPFFLTSSIIIPVAAFLMIESVQWNNPLLIKISFLSWGLGLMLLQVCTLPYIMRTTPKSVLSEAITLNFSMWSLAIIVTGISIGLLTRLQNFTLFNISFIWDEYHIILLFILISLSAIIMISRMKESKPRSASSEFSRNFASLILDYDWSLIIKALVPTLLIAVGAGLTIPFINLFFYSVFKMDSAQFGILGSIASAMSFIAVLLSPTLKRKYGYNISIILTQSIAIMFLVVLVLTELFSMVEGIIYVAIGSYIIRQPLMQISSPITSELTMKYVGEKNQELISAINSSIWSASWFISAKIFQYLRELNYPYYKIFIITAVMYSIGVFLFYFIIKEYKKRKIIHKPKDSFERIIIED